MFIRARRLFLLAFISTLVLNLNAATQFTLNPGDYYRIVERQNLRIHKNGKYKGFLYREYRAFLHTGDAAFETSPGRYEGEYYVLENLKRDALFVAKAVDSQYTAKFSINSQGDMLVDKGLIVPIHRNFPAFSPKTVEQGKSWDVSGSDLVSDSKGNHYRIPFLCHYIFRGTGTYLSRPVSIIDAQYALRYERGGAGTVSKTFKSISGSRKAVIMLYTDAIGGIFIKSDIKQCIVYPDGSNEKTEGFILTWYTGISGQTVVKTNNEIKEKFTVLKKEKGTSSGLAQNNLKGITMEKSRAGLVLKIHNIHFLPNSPEIMPDEKQRLDSIAEVLNTAKNCTFLVTGHTADVGSKESQQELSVQRAKVIVDELVKRGFSPKLFMFEGKGGTEPVASNGTKEGRSLNRRVEITILN